MKKVVGFTLIELVVVIVILGILAVTAAPKFLGLQVDARNAALKGLEGSLKSALAVGYAKMALLGYENAPYVTNRPKSASEANSSYIFSADLSTLNCPVGDSTTCTFSYGYPYDRSTFSKMLENIVYAHQGASGWVYLNSNVINDPNVTSEQTIFTNAKNVTYSGENATPSLKSNSCYIFYAPPLDNKSSYTLNLKQCQ
ncbi:TPA: type II secretion system protein [Photobacterium damselae]